MNEDETSARDRAVWSLRTEIRRTARDVFGAVWTETPIEGYRLLTRSGLDEPLAGVRAAVLARDVAAGQVREYAEAARGAGASWDAIGAALGITAEDAEGGLVGELAFGLLIEGRTLSSAGRDRLWREPSAWWTCRSCGQRVTDRGPHEANPEDNESGHGEGCARHAAEIATFRAAWGDDG